MKKNLKGIEDFIDEMKHFLPSQLSLKDFIHHNTLHAFQDLKFKEAIFKASYLFGYQVTFQLDEYRKLFEQGRIREQILDRVILQNFGKAKMHEVKWDLFHQEYDQHRVPKIGQLRSKACELFGLDLDREVHPFLFRILSHYLDQGVSFWNWHVSPDGFLSSLRALESNGIVSLYKTKKARELFVDPNLDIEDLLEILVGDERLYKQYLFDQQFSHHGWSGFVSAVEDNPVTLLDSRKISLRELIYFELLLEIDALEYKKKGKWKPLGNFLKNYTSEWDENFALSELDKALLIWQEAFEWSYYDEVLGGILQHLPQPETSHPDYSFQAVFCVDERECSLRRHLEGTDDNCATYGTPGFFNVEFYYLAEGAKFYEKLCPAPVTPKHLIKALKGNHKRKSELLYGSGSHHPITGWFFSTVLGLWAFAKTVLMLFKPRMSPAISDAFAHMDETSELQLESSNPPLFENNLQLGFTVIQMADRVEALLKSIGMVDHFSPIVYILAHGSSSANNPHHGAHDCGACSGRPGSVNARVFSLMANHPDVRKILATRGISIPENTFFIGGMHDTAADEIRFFDVQKHPDTVREMHQQRLNNFHTALELNAKERSRRFASIRTQNSTGSIRKSIKNRSVSLFEPRPELGHGTNSVCIIGRRSISRRLFLDRRAFLNSYDYRIDPEGKILTAVMRPIGPVCGGINLEYYFSRMDNHKFGAGTKLPHHVIGLFGVTNSVDGDLRPGLPVQMIEVHDPVRLLIVVEHYPEIILKAIQSTPEMYEWYINEWVHLVCVFPGRAEMLTFRDGEFTPYTCIKSDINHHEDFHRLVESATEMETNHILDATKENLPVYTIKN
ncbi:MAG: DUF2309 domain-containing protein [Saprospiraceae bacterium]|nr:DUF2309 domain-containing protein [Candidatus Vicinibacter affinis]